MYFKHSVEHQHSWRVQPPVRYTLFGMQEHASSNFTGILENWNVLTFPVPFSERRQSRCNIHTLSEVNRSFYIVKIEIVCWKHVTALSILVFGKVPNICEPPVILLLFIKRHTFQSMVFSSLANPWRRCEQSSTVFIVQGRNTFSQFTAFGKNAYT